MSDFQTQQSEFLGGVQSAKTPEQLRAEQAAITAAQHPVQQPPPAQQQTRFFTEDDIARARQEEKDKLYPRLTEMEQRFKIIEDERTAAEAEKKRLADEAEEARKAKELSEMTNKDLLLKLNADMQAKFQDFEAQLALKDSLLAKERQFQMLQEFKAQQLVVAAPDIIPDLIQTIDGNNEQEILASIERAKQITAKIVSDFAQSQQQQVQQMQGVQPFGAPVHGPMDDQSVQKPLSKEYVDNAGMSEYAKNRVEWMKASSRAYYDGQR